MIILLAIFLALAVSDAAYTTRMLSKHGVAIELNPAIQRLAARFGLVAGVWLGVMIPTLVIAALAFLVPPLLAVMVPARALLCGMQLARTRNECLFQKKIKHYSRMSISIPAA
jgi:hypothetical protein